jgi:hypothetical protein
MTAGTSAQKVADDQKGLTAERAQDDDRIFFFFSFFLSRQIGWYRRKLDTTKGVGKTARRPEEKSKRLSMLGVRPSGSRKENKKKTTWVVLGSVVVVVVAGGCAGHIGLAGCTSNFIFLFCRSLFNFESKK